MFNIFNNISEMTLIFKEDRLFYANEAALYLFNSYEISLINKEMVDFFKADDIVEIKSMLKTEKDFNINLNFKIGKTLNCKVKVFDEYGYEYLMIQAKSSSKYQKERDLVKIVAPKAAYDPLRIGKAYIINYELSDPYMKIQGMLRSMSKSGVEKEQLNEISTLLNRFYEKTKLCLDEFMDFDEKYKMLNSVFDVNDLLIRITKRLNNYFIYENINAEITYSAIKGKNVKVCCDYNKIANSVITLIVQLINVMHSKRKRAEITLELVKDKEYCYINIIAKSVMINKKVYDEIIKSNTEIINLDRYKENKITMNIHLVNAFVELSDGELFVKRDKKEGTLISIKLPLTKKKYFVNETQDIHRDEIIDKIIRKIMTFNYI